MDSEEKYHCCALANTPHVHTFGDTDEVYPLDTKFSVTFFLQDGLKVPVIWEADSTYIRDDLVVLGSGPTAEIWYCEKKTQTIPSIGDNWTLWTTKSAWKDRWGKYSEYSAGDIVYTYDGMYKCLQDSPAGVFPADSLCDRCESKKCSTNIFASKHMEYDDGPKCNGRWLFLNTVGKKFPPWMKHPTLFSIDLDMSETLRLHPSTGAIHWELPNEHYIGHEVSSIDREHPTIQKLFRDHGKTEMTKLYTAKIVHSGTCTPPRTIDEPNPKDQKFFGLTIGAYVIPPESYNPDTDATTTGGQDGHVTKTNGVISSDSKSDDKTDLLKDAQNLLPMISSQTGEQFSVIYLQWQADELGFIAQPSADSADTNTFHDAIMVSFLCLANREPHPTYMRMFDNSARAAHHGNMIDTSTEYFKREFINECIRTGKPVPRGNISAEYKKWNMGKMIERAASISAAQKLFAEANDKWLDWLWNLRQKTEKLHARCNFIAQDHFGVEKWINSDGKSIKVSDVKWEYTCDKSKSIISIQTVFDEIEIIERIWKVMEHSVPGLMTYYINCIESRISNVTKMISQYQFRDNLNRNDTKKKRSRGRGGNGRN
jgi:hypothetical protein